MTEPGSSITRRVWQTRLAFALASVALLVPCFWQSRVQAGDLASHIYNTWLAELIHTGRAPGLVIARQSTNVLFDLLLGALYAGLGPGPAQRIAAGLAVLVFAWGAFAFVSAVVGRRVWDLLPCIAMLSYGWVFHIGFFNFHLGLGLCLWALALTWNAAASRILVAAPILALAWLAHALPVAWAISIIAFGWIWRGLAPRLRLPALLLALVALGLLSAGIHHTLPARWGTGQVALITGADQLRVFDGKYDGLAGVLLAVWLALFANAIRGDGWRAVLSKLELHVFVLCAAGVLVIPRAILIPGYGHALVYIAERMSLTAAVVACAVVAPRRPDASRFVFAAIAVVFFAFLYRDEHFLNRFEDRLESIVAQVPEGQRVIFGVRTPELRVNALTHMIDRACIGRCYSYANYEPSTRQFRIRVAGRSPLVTSTHAESTEMQRGGYVVQPPDVPLHQVVVAPDGQLAVRSLGVGERSSGVGVDPLPDLF